jgi:hypothetical protein
MKRIYLLLLIFLCFPNGLFASGKDISAQSENIITDKHNVLLLEKLVNAEGSGILGDVKIGDNGVTRMNDGHLLIKVSGYSDSAIMKYVNSMVCTLPRKLSSIKSFDGNDKIQNMKTFNNGLYIKSGIEAEKDSGIFVLASGGVELDGSSGPANNQLNTPNVFFGGGIGYFLKNYTMQVGYDNKVGAAASFGILW